MENIKISLESVNKIIEYCVGHSNCKFCIYYLDHRCMMEDEKGIMPYEWAVNKDYLLSQSQRKILYLQCVTMDCHVCPYYCDTITTRKCVMVDPEHGTPQTW